MSKLIIVGTGINIFSHLTLEAQRWIEQAETVFYLLNAPIAVQWMQEQRPDADDLGALYTSRENRREVYDLIAQRILAALDNAETVCAVFYGHPMVFVSPSLQLIREAQADHEIAVCPGISAEDCLFADLGIDPASRGCQSYEATDFVLRPRTIDPSTALVLWQVGVIGNLTSRIHEQMPQGIALLRAALLRHYPPEHRVYFYEAAMVPGGKPHVQIAAVQDMTQAQLSPATTLYVPPATAPQVDADLAQTLQIDVDML